MIAVPNYISPAEYLEIERQNPIRHEYRRGLVYAMASGTDNHVRIAFNLLKLTDNYLEDPTDCRFYSGNVKVGYQGEFYYYPDAFVTCDPRVRDDRYIKRYPKLIIEVLSSSTEESDTGEKFIAEVLSSSTEGFDTGEKFKDYLKRTSLEEYVLIAQETQQVECRRRSVDGTWETVVYGEDDRVLLSSIGLEFDISELYRGVDG
jgi:Uma2 family endonuclease